MAWTGRPIERDSTHLVVWWLLGSRWSPALHQTMTTFSHLTESLTPSGQQAGSPCRSQKDRDDHFPSVVSASPFRLWSPGKPLPAKGKCLLIGVATWSVYDMRLLDAVAQSLKKCPRDLTVAVFNVADCTSQEVFDRYVPGIGPVLHTPVVGLWSDGNLADKATGRAGRELVARVSGLDASELDRLLTAG